MDAECKKGAQEGGRKFPKAGKSICESGTGSSSVICHSRAHPVELLHGGGEPQVLVVGDHLQGVGAARHGLGAALRGVQRPRDGKEE